jgi:hypothetical protein
VSKHDASPLTLSLKVLLIVTALEALVHLILSLQQNGVSESPLTPGELADILSVEWSLAFIGIVTLVSTYYSTAQTQRDDQALRGLPEAGIISVILILFVYLIWPWLEDPMPWNTLFIRVILTNAVGAGMLGYCIFKARGVRKVKK